MSFWENIFIIIQFKLKKNALLSKIKIINLWFKYKYVIKNTSFKIIY